MQLLQLLLLFFILPSTAQASVVRTPLLIQAVQSGHMRLIGQLIRGGTEINAINAWGRTAAHYAVTRNNRKALKLLLDNSADANLADNDGNTPLDMWHKHKHKNEKMLALLHAAGVEPLDLFQVAAKNYRSSAERLLAAGADAKAENDAGKVPFDIAVEAEHYALAAVLLKAAVGIDGRDKKSWTPLHWAIFGDAWDLVREFIREDADISAGRRQDVFDLAEFMGSEAKLIEIFIDEKGVDATVGKDGDTVLILAAKKGSKAIVELLLANKADPNISNHRGNTALMFAARNRHMEIVKLLIDNKADLNIKTDQYGETALMLAAKGGHTDIAKLLIANKADPNIKSRMKETALFYAARGRHMEIVKLLIENNVNINIKNKNGQSSLTFAAFYERKEIVKFLIENKATKSNINTALINVVIQGQKEMAELFIENKADLNITTKDSYTVLMFALLYGRLEIAKLLIENNADPNIKTNDGKTALFYAAKQGYMRVAELLIENGADPNPADNSGETALSIAEKNGHSGVVDILRAAQEQ